ncbi:MAG: hypothetical protein PHF86_07605 [Candidatus Nanoarchaeia archaeon]|jgi:hypothetical protein|nr:hypothetical protein [Candidatus Nanoarchaeia archaeon]
MNKQSFNKENPVDLFSQLIKVLSKQKEHNNIDSLIDKIRALSSDVFKELNKNSNFSIIDELLKEAKYKRFFSIEPDINGTLSKIQRGGFKIELSGNIEKINNPDEIIEVLRNAWKKLQ